MAFTIKPGTKAPDFNLSGTDGKQYTLADFADARVVVIGFTCNHCPYVIGSEDRLIRFANDYRDRGVALVCINSNETENHPEDSFELMIERVKDKAYNFPYLRDEKQDAAKAFGAIKTPHFFVLDQGRVVRYTGRMDDHPKDETLATTHELRDAVEDLLAGREFALAVTETGRLHREVVGQTPEVHPRRCVRSDLRVYKGP